MPTPSSMITLCTALIAVMFIRTRSPMIRAGVGASSVGTISMQFALISTFSPMEIRLPCPGPIRKGRQMREPLPKRWKPPATSC